MWVTVVNMEKYATHYYTSQSNMLNSFFIHCTEESIPMLQNDSYKRFMDKVEK